MTDTTLPLTLLCSGKVREVYEVDSDRLLMVTSDRLSAFDVVLPDPIPSKGKVLNQISAFWFQKLRNLIPNHLITADFAEIVAAVPQLAPCRTTLAGRSMLVRRSRPVPFECVVRGYLAGSAWSEYRVSGTLAGDPLPAGLREGDKLPTPLFSPATKATSGHDVNISPSLLLEALGPTLAGRLEEASLALYREGCGFAGERGIIIADTKFEFGILADGSLMLIDELLTPDSSRFWPVAAPGETPISLDKQPVRDYLAGLRKRGIWNGEPPGPELPAEVISSTSARYRELFRRLTGAELLE